MEIGSPAGAIFRPIVLRLERISYHGNPHSCSGKGGLSRPRLHHSIILRPPFPDLSHLLPLARDPVSAGTTRNPGFIGWHVAYFSNVLAARADVDVQSVWGHLWSLSVEEQFYLLWPAVVLWCPRRWLSAGFVAAIVTGPIFRVVAGVLFGVKPAVYLTPGCLDSLGLRTIGMASLQSGTGCVETFVLPVEPDCWMWLECCCGSKCVLGRELVVMVVGPRSVPALIFCWFVNATAEGFRGWTGKLLECRPLIYMGTISYGMYLFHNFIPWICEYAGLPLPPYGITRFLILAPVTIAVAAISWHIFEKPLNALKDSFPYTRATLKPLPIHSAVEPVAVGSTPHNQQDN